MAEFWQWEGDANTGAGLVHFTGSETVSISGNITLGSMLKGSPVLIHTITLTATLTADATTTAGETSIVGFNSIMLETSMVSGGRTVKTVIDGSMSSGGTMVSIIDKDTSAQMTATATANKTVKFTGLPDYLGFSTTLSAGMTAGSSATVKVLPLNL